MSKDNFINLVNNSDLSEKGGLLCFLLYIKTSKTYYQRYIDVILDRANKYYENDKEILREQAKNKCRKLSEVQNNIKKKSGSNKYHMSEDKKNKNISKKVL